MKELLLAGSAIGCLAFLFIAFFTVLFTLVIYGVSNLVLTPAFDLPSLTLLQSFGVAIVLNIIRAVLTPSVTSNS